MKLWMIVTVETEIEWPTQETTHEFAGHTLILRPPEGEAAADVRIHYEHPQSEQEALETICRFLSALSWWQHRPARGRLRISCTAPMRGGKGSYGTPSRMHYLIPHEVAQQPDPKARLALALYREARSVRGTPYEFLGYFKVINSRYSKGDDQIKWIGRNRPPAYR